MLKYVDLKKIFKFGIRKKLLRRGKVEKTIQSFSFKRKLINYDIILPRLRIS